MNIEEITNNARLFLLIFVRVYAMLRLAPLISSASIPSLVRLMLVFFTAALVIPAQLTREYPLPDNNYVFMLLLLGEALIGIITAFLLQLVFTAFQVAGEIFSLQMGFSASQVLDPFTLVQIPLMGQFVNIIALFMLVTVQGFQRLFIVGIMRSFDTLRAVDMVTQRENILTLTLSRFAGLFENAMAIAFPIFGSLFLVYVAIGLLAKAAPQMNLLVIGFPFSIAVAFLLLFLGLPLIVDGFTRVIDYGYETALRFVAFGRVQ